MTGMEALAIAALAATAVSTIGSMQQQKATGKAQRDAAHYRKSVADVQAQAMEQEAGQTRAASQRQAIEAQEAGKQVSGQIRAASAGSGALDPSVVNLLGRSEQNTEFNRLAALYRGEEAAIGMEHQADIMRAGGLMDAWTGDTQAELANRQAMLTGIGGLGQMAGDAYTFGQSGAFKTKPKTPSTQTIGGRNKGMWNINY